MIFSNCIFPGPGPSICLTPLLPSCYSLLDIFNELLPVVRVFISLGRELFKDRDGFE